MHAAPAVTSSFRPLTPSWRHWIFVAAGIGTLLLAIDFIAPSNPIRVWYWMRFVAPAQQQRYGFVAELASDHQCLSVTAVTPGGAFANAGIQPGFVPIERSCLGFSTVELFFHNLRETHGGTLKLEFVSGGCPIRFREGSIPVTVSVPATKTAG